MAITIEIDPDYIEENAQTFGLLSATQTQTFTDEQKALAQSNLDLDVWITQPGDADYVLDLVTTSGSPIVTSATANWPGDCVGKPIAIANGLGNGAKLRTTILSRQSSTQITLATNCTRTNNSTQSGAVYGTDFGPILQYALNQLDSRHGGVVRFTPGRRLLFTPVAKVFGSANHVEIDGQGSSFCLSVPQGEDGLVVTNSDILTLRNIAFIGCQNEIEDAHRCISVSAIKKVNIFNVDCHALASCLLADGAVIDVSQTLLRMRDCNVSGCTASANLDTGVILLREMLGTKVENLTMLDWSNFGGSILTKTGVSSPIAWVKVSEPGQGEPGSAPMRYGPFTFDSCYFDEAAVNAILVQSSDVKFRSVCVRDCRVNVTVLGTGSGLRIEDAELVEIVDTSIGYTANAVPGIRILDCGTAILRRVKTDGGAAEVTIDSSADHVLVEDCDIGTLTSASPDTVVRRSNEIQDLPASKITSGTMARARLPSEVGYKDETGIWATQHMAGVYIPQTESYFNFVGDGNNYFGNTTNFRNGAGTVTGASINGATGYIQAGAATTSNASIRLPHGTAPTSPQNGDMWTTSAGLFVRINGATIGPLT
jgi:hypothetical protein